MSGGGAVSIPQLRKLRMENTNQQWKQTGGRRRLAVLFKFSSEAQVRRREQKRLQASDFWGVPFEKRGGEGA